MKTSKHGGIIKCKYFICVIFIKFSYIVVVAFLLGCSNTQKKRTTIDKGNKIVGEIDKNGQYFGHIRFYDTSSDLLTGEGEFNGGLKDGNFKTYYKNGKLKADISYSNGLENGLYKVFDTNGSILSIDNYFYGLRAGNSVKYQSGKLRSYSFYSLENSQLLHFEYDSLKPKHLPDWFSDFFFYSKSWFSTDTQDSIFEKIEYFLYTPNPPLQEFYYSLVKVDKSLKIISVIKEFDNRNSWVKFDIDTPIGTSPESMAIHLKIMDSVNHAKINLIKVLK